MRTGAGEEFVFVEPCLARITWCANRVLGALGSCFAEYHVSHGFCAVLDVVLPLMSRTGKCGRQRAEGDSSLGL